MFGKKTRQSLERLFHHVHNPDSLVNRLESVMSGESQHLEIFNLSDIPDFETDARDYMPDNITGSSERIIKNAAWTMCKGKISEWSTLRSVHTRYRSGYIENDSEESIVLEDYSWVSGEGVRYRFYSVSGGDELYSGVRWFFAT